MAKKQTNNQQHITTKPSQSISFVGKYVCRCSRHQFRHQHQHHTPGASKILNLLAHFLFVCMFVCLVVCILNLILSLRALTIFLQYAQHIRLVNSRFSQLCDHISSAGSFFLLSVVRVSNFILFTLGFQQSIPIQNKQADNFGSLAKEPIIRKKKKTAVNVPSRILN